MVNDIAVTVKLDLTRNRGSEVIYARQSDTKVHNLRIVLTNNGKIIDLTDAVTCIMYIKKPSGTEYANTMTRTGNELSYTLRTEDIDTVGTVEAQVYVQMTGGTKLTSPAFEIEVFSSILDSDLNNLPQESVNKYKAITDILDEAEQEVTEAKTYADKAKQYDDEIAANYANYVTLKGQMDNIKAAVDTSASTASSKASSASASAVSASTSASNAAASASTATSKANSASSSATSAANSSTSANASAVSASTSASNAKTSENNAKSYMEQAKAAVPEDYSTLISDVNTLKTSKQDKLTNPLTQSDVVNNLTSTSTVTPLSANQGKVLNDEVTSVNETLGTLGDTIPKLVNDDSVNIFKTSLTSATTSNGITVTPNADGTLVVSGTNSKSAVTYIPIGTVTVPSVDAILGGFTNNDNVGVYIQGTTATQYANSTTHTVTADYGKSLTLGIAVKSSATVSNVTVKPMVTTCTYLTEFVPYYDKGIASINETLGDLTTNGSKSLVDIADVTNSVTDTKTYLSLYIKGTNASGTVTSLGSISQINTVGRKSITFTPTSAQVNFFLFHSGSGKDITFTTTTYNLVANQTYTISFDVNGYNPSTVGGVVIKNIMLEKGSVAHDYEPTFDSVHQISASLPNKVDYASKGNSSTTGFTTKFYGIGLLTIWHTGSLGYEVALIISTPSKFQAFVLSSTLTTYKVTYADVSRTDLTFSATWATAGYMWDLITLSTR